MEAMTELDKILLSVSFLALLVYVYITFSSAILPAAGIHLPLIPGAPYTRLACLLLIFLTCFTFLRNWKATAFITVVLFIVPWAAEVLSVHTGIPFGNYYYSPSFAGPLVLGVPLLLGIFYIGFYFFPAYFISNLLVDGEIFTREKSWWKGTLFTSFIASIIVAGIDMLGDPTSATRLHQWTWTDNSFTAYYGIPYLNYLGYVIVITPIVFLFKYYEIRNNVKPRGPVTLGIFIIPFLVYGLVYLIDAVLGPAGMVLIGCFTLLLPLVLSVNKLIQFFSKQEEA